MEVKCKALHMSNHYGMNRFEEAWNEKYFRFPRSLIRKIVSECIVCSQAQPLKTKKKVNSYNGS